MNFRWSAAAPPLAFACLLLTLAAAWSQQALDSPSNTLPAAQSNDAEKVEADGLAAGDKGHSILDELLSDKPPEEKPPPEENPSPPPQPRPAALPPPEVVAAVAVLHERLGTSHDPVPPAEVRRVRYEIAQQLAGYQNQIANRIGVEENAAAVRLLSQVGRAAAQREPAVPERDPQDEIAAPPRFSREIQIGPSPTYQQLNDYVEPVSSAVGGPRPSSVAPIDPQRREIARRIFGGEAPASPVTVAAAAPGEAQEAARAEASRAFGDDAGVGSLAGKQSATEFFSPDEAAPVYAQSPYWRANSATEVGDGSVVGARGASSGSDSATTSAVNAESRRISDFDSLPPPAPIISISASGSGDDDVGGVRIGFSIDALRGAAIPARLSFEFERRLASARNEKELADAMREINVEAARKISGPLSSHTIDGLTVVSLKKLCDELEDHRRRSIELPDRVRNPGSLRRIVGYFLVPEAEDLLILGSRNGSGPPLDVDDLIVAFQAVWRDGRDPACSLDPNPHDFGGPQLSRILGVPQDSHFAAVMLRADYEMKRVLFGQRSVGVPGFVDLKTRLSGLLKRNELGSEPQWLARFWFTPSPPRAGDVQISPDGRMTIFDAKMRLETEAMEVRGASLGGTGRADPILREMMQQFTASMQAMQKAVSEFAELQTLFDAVMLAAVLKSADVNHPLLRRLTALHHRPLEVPSSYPGLTTFIDYEEVTVMAIQGGVATRPTLGRASYAVRIDASLDPLRRAGVELSSVLTTDRKESLVILERQSRATEQADSGLLEIRQLIASGRVRSAIDAATERVRRNSADPDGYLLRSEAYAAAGLYYLAERDLRLAGVAGADSQRLFILRAKIGNDRSDSETPRQLLTAENLDRLADVYFDEIARSAASGELGEALKRLERVEKLDVKQSHAAAWRIRLLSASGRTDEARTVAAKATEKYSEDSTLWLLRVSLARLDDTARTAEALRWVGRAVELDPRSVDALLMRAKLRVVVDALEADAAKDDVRRALKLAPNHPEAAVVQSRIQALQGDLDGALAACHRAIRNSPGYVPAYLQRIYVRSLQGDTPAAYVANLRDCNKILTVKPQDWSTRTVRADMFTKLDDERLAELVRDPKRMASIVSPILVEHFQSLSILPKLENAAPGEEPEAALRFLSLIRLGLAEAAAADLAMAATTAPTEIAARLRERADRLKAEIKLPP